METKARLNNGKEINYGAGLSLGEYRGLKTVSHSGGDAGYTSNILQFPEQHFSVIILANTGGLNLTAVSQNIADKYLDGKFLVNGPVSGTPRGPGETIGGNKVERTPLTPSQLQGFVGNYYSDELNVVYEVGEKDGNLIVSYSLGHYPLEHVSSDAFVGPFPISRLQFTRDKDGQCDGFAITDDDRAQHVQFAKISFAK
jgi:hypothetical protein